MLPCLIPFTINWGLPSRRNEIISLWVASQACPHSFFFPHCFSRHYQDSSFWNVPDLEKQGIVTIALKNSPPLEWTHTNHLSSLSNGGRTLKGPLWYTGWHIAWLNFGNWSLPTTFLRPFEPLNFFFAFLQNTLYLGSVFRWLWA